MAKNCLCLTASTIEENLEILEKNRKYVDLAELRVDCLTPDERLYLRRFPKLAGLPVILTIRRDIDGGFFSGGEGARVKLMARGLAYAEANSRLNFAYVDIEEDLEVPSLEEAARTFGTRIIRSWHNLQGTGDNLYEKIKSLQRVGDEIVKVSVTANSTADVLKVFRMSEQCAIPDKIIICMGYYGSYTRILAERFGSHLSYSSPPTEKTAALGQIDTQELAELYRFREITKNTRIYGIIGNPLKSSVSPLFFNNIFRLENTDAVYVPFPVTSADEFMELADALDVQGLSVTAPYKETVLPFLARKSAQVQSIGACNTMNLCEDGWYGENTDAPGFSGSILNFIGRKNLKWKKITIIGAGGVARAVASEISRLGGRAIIINRSVHKARAIALLYNLGWGGLDKNGVDLMNRHSDIIIQASSAGMEGSPSDDPLEIYSFSGKETVMDLIYTPEVTPFLRRAVQAGCKTINGYDMVIRQACLQYECFFSKEFPRHFLPMLDRSLNDAGEF